MESHYSIADARNKFTKLVQHVEGQEDAVTITRRGKRVAMLISVEQYEELSARPKKRGFMDAYDEFRQRYPEREPSPIDDPSWADNLRSRDPGREVNLWD